MRLFRPLPVLEAAPRFDLSFSSPSVLDGDLACSLTSASDPKRTSEGAASGHSPRLVEPEATTLCAERVDGSCDRAWPRRRLACHAMGGKECYPKIASSGTARGRLPISA